MKVRERGRHDGDKRHRRIDDRKPNQIRGRVKERRRWFKLN